MTCCARCDWQPDTTDDAPPPREQLRQHALDWGHPLCRVCARSLGEHEPATCDPCIQRVQETLSGVLLLWQELPRQLGHAKAQVYDRDGRGGAEEHALPGGTVFALLAPGSVGNVLPRSGNAEHLEDNRADSTPSIAWTLMSWEDDWRRARGDGAAQNVGSNAQVARAAAGYLERHTRWAANNHDAFDEYASDLQDLHARLEVATGRVRRPVKAGASCFDCGGTLERPLHEVTEQGRTGLVEVEDAVVCRQCGSRYDGARYLLALAAKAQEGRESLHGWVAVPAAAAASKRPVRTLRAWLGTHVPWALRIEPRQPTPDNPSPWRTVQHLAWYPALAERAEKAQRRRMGA